MRHKNIRTRHKSEVPHPTELGSHSQFFQDGNQKNLSKVKPSVLLIQVQPWVTIGVIPVTFFTEDVKRNST